MLLRPKMDALETHVGGHKPLSAHLRFLKDVLYGLHVFAIEARGLSLHEQSERRLFQILHKPLRPRSQKEVP